MEVMGNFVKNLFVFTVVGIFLSAVSCGKPQRVVYSSFRDIPAAGWDSRDPLVFEIGPEDSLDTEPTSPRGVLEICVRYSLRSRISELPLCILVEDDAGTTVKSDTLRIRMTDSNGGPAGKGNHGLKQVSVAVDSSFHATSGTSVTLIPLSPRQNNSGILEVGLVCTAR